MFSVSIPRMARRLLLVDDDASLGVALARTLRGAGFSVTVVVTAAEGLAVLARQRFDVVLSDMNLTPPEQGDQFLREVAAVAPDAMRIVYSGKRLVDTSFAHASFEKPCSAEEIRAVFDAWVAGRTRS